MVYTAQCLHRTPSYSGLLRRSCEYLLHILQPICYHSIAKIKIAQSLPSLWRLISSSLLLKQQHDNGIIHQLHTFHCNSSKVRYREWYSFKYDILRSTTPQYSGTLCMQWEKKLAVIVYEKNVELIILNRKLQLDEHFIKHFLMDRNFF